MQRPLLRTRNGLRLPKPAPVRQQFPPNTNSNNTNALPRKPPFTSLDACRQLLADSHRLLHPNDESPDMMLLLLRDWRKGLNELVAAAATKSNASPATAENQLAFLKRSVDTVDLLVRQTLQTSNDNNTKFLAAHVGIKAWSALSSFDVDAAERAAELLDLFLQKEAKKPSSSWLETIVQWTTGANTQDAHAPPSQPVVYDLYKALFYAWRRSSNPAASDRLIALIKKLKQEEATRQMKLMDSILYDSALAACAKWGDVDQARWIWHDMKQCGLEPTSLSYNSFARTIDVQQRKEYKSELAVMAADLFIEHLDRYSRNRPRDVLCKPLILTMKNVFSTCRNDPDVLRTVLTKVLAFEARCSEYRGKLVTHRSFALVIMSFVNQDQPEKAEEILRQCIRVSNSQVLPRVLALVVHGYARRNTLDGFANAERILNLLDEQLVKTDDGKVDTDEHYRVYLSLMQIYLATRGKDALASIQQLIQRLFNLSRQFNNPSLHPDRRAYNIFMQAIITHAGPKFETDIEAVYHAMESQTTDDNEHEKLRSLEIVLSAWLKSQDPNAPERAQKLLDAYKLDTNSAAPAVMIRLYARHANVTAAYELLRQLQQSDKHASGNSICSTVLGLLKKAAENSKDADLITETLERVNEIFKDMERPTKYNYILAFSFFAQHKLADEAVDLFKRMKEDYETGRNACQPDSYVGTLVLDSLDPKSPNAFEVAEDVFHHVAKPDKFMYSYFFNIIAERGLAHEAIGLFHRMQSDFLTGVNSDCRPNNYAYAAILKALLRSDEIDAAETARAIYDSIEKPGVICSKRLVDIYAKYGQTGTATS
jgi:pentatricopeptide repeat protein